MITGRLIIINSKLTITGNLIIKNNDLLKKQVFISVSTLFAKSVEADTDIYLENSSSIITTHYFNCHNLYGESAIISHGNITIRNDYM